MEHNIIRKYPTIKDERVYKDRYNKDDFITKFKQMELVVVYYLLEKI